MLRPAGSIDGGPLGYVECLPPGYGTGDPTYAVAEAGCDVGLVPISAFHGGADSIVPKSRIVARRRA
jgi:hypothetical protein